MPISVRDLKPGDRVVLNCPKARGQTKREAVFRGIFATLDEALNHNQDHGLVTFLQGGAAEFLGRAGSFAKFTMQRVTGPSRVLEYPGGGAIAGIPDSAGVTELIAAFPIDPDGGLHEEFGRRIYVEQRMTMGQG